MLPIKSIVGICLLFVVFNINAQNPEADLYTKSNKGKFFVSWDGNRRNSQILISTLEAQVMISLYQMSRHQINLKVGILTTSILAE